jgi:GDP-L-fucose synthase
LIDSDVLKSFCDAKVIVTGGTGLIGRQVVSILCDAGANVTSVSLDHLQLDSRARYIYCDLSSFTSCKLLTIGMDYVFHIAGIKGSIDVTKSKPASFFVPLLMMNTNVLEACRINKVSKVLYTSSIGAYSDAEVFIEHENLGSDPMDMFPGWAKRMAEKQIEAYNIQYGLDNFSIVRLANVFGEGDCFDSMNAMVIPSLMSRIYNGEHPLKVWGEGSAVRDFIYSKDVAEGIILALYYGTDSKFVNLGSGCGYSIKKLVETMSQFIGFKYEFDVSKSSGFPRRVMDISLAKERIKFNPTTSLVDGLKNTWQWYLLNTSEHLNKKNYFQE